MGAVCANSTTKAVDGAVVGLKLPPLDVCTDARCRCDFRPRGCDVAMKRLARGVRGSVPAQRGSSPGLKPPMAAAPQRGPRGRKPRESFARNGTESRSLKI